MNGSGRRARLSVAASLAALAAAAAGPGAGRRRRRRCTARCSPRSRTARPGSRAMASGASGGGLAQDVGDARHRPPGQRGRARPACPSRPAARPAACRYARPRRARPRPRSSSRRACGRSVVHTCARPASTQPYGRDCSAPRHLRGCPARHGGHGAPWRLAQGPSSDRGLLGARRRGQVAAVTVPGRSASGETGGPACAAMPAACPACAFASSPGSDVENCVVCRCAPLTALRWCTAPSFSSVSGRAAGRGDGRAPSRRASHRPTELV